MSTKCFAFPANLDSLEDANLDHLKYLFDMRWHFLCLVNNISVKANLFNSFCVKCYNNICNEILSDGNPYEIKTTLNEISIIHYSLLEEALFLESYGDITKSLEGKISQKLEEVYENSWFHWKNNTKFSFCSMDLLLEFSNLSNEAIDKKNTTIGDIISPMLKNVKIVLKNTISEAIIKPFQLLIDILTERGQRHKSFNVVTTEELRGKFRAHKIKILKRIDGINESAELLHVYDLYFECGKAATEDVMAILSINIRKFDKDFSLLQGGKAYFFQFDSKEKYLPVPANLALHICLLNLNNTEDYYYPITTLLKVESSSHESSSHLLLTQSHSSPEDIDETDILSSSINTSSSSSNRNIFSLIEHTSNNVETNYVTDAYFKTNWNNWNNYALGQIEEAEDNNNTLLEKTFEEEQTQKKISYFNELIENKTYFNDLMYSTKELEFHVLRAHKVISDIEGLTEEIFKMFFLFALTEIGDIPYTARNRSLMFLTTKTEGWISKVSIHFYGKLKLDYLRRALESETDTFKIFFIYRKYFKPQNKKKFNFEIAEMLKTYGKSIVDFNKIESNIEKWFVAKGGDKYNNTTEELKSSLLNPEDKFVFEELDNLAKEFEKPIQRYDSSLYQLSVLSKSRLATFFVMCNSLLNIEQNLCSAEIKEKKEKLLGFFGVFINKINFVDKLKQICMTETTKEANKRSKQKKNETTKENSSSSSSSLIQIQPITSSRFSARLVKDIEQEVVIDHKVSNVYSLIHKASNSLGGNSCNAPIYGEVTTVSFQKIVNYLKSSCNMCIDSRFIDIGSGLGKPNFHVAQDPIVRLSIGIEVDEIRYQISILNWNQIALKSNDNVFFKSVNFIKGSIEMALTLDPFTHVYMFDVGFPAKLMKLIAIKFNASIYTEILVSYHTYRKIEDYGFEVDFLHQLQTSMTVSGEKHFVYFYRRKLNNNKVPIIPKAKKHFNLQNLTTNKVEIVYCDYFFVEACRQVLFPSPCDELKDRMMKINRIYMNSVRKKRVKSSPSSIINEELSSNNEDSSEEEEDEEKKSIENTKKRKKNLISKSPPFAAADPSTIIVPEQKNERDIEASLLKLTIELDGVLGAQFTKNESSSGAQENEDEKTPAEEDSSKKLVTAVLAEADDPSISPIKEAADKRERALEKEEKDVNGVNFSSNEPTNPATAASSSSPINETNKEEDYNKLVVEEGASGAQDEKAPTDEDSSSSEIFKNVVTAVMREVVADVVAAAAGAEKKIDDFFNNEIINDHTIVEPAAAATKQNMDEQEYKDAVEAQQIKINSSSDVPDAEQTTHHSSDNIITAKNIVILFEADIAFNSSTLVTNLLKDFTFPENNIESKFGVIYQLFDVYKKEYMDKERFLNLQNRRINLSDEERTFYDAYILSQKNDNRNPKYRFAGDKVLHILEFASLSPEQWVSSEVIELYNVMLNCRESSLSTLDEKRPKNFFIDNFTNSIYINVYQYDNLYCISNISNNHWIFVKIVISTKHIIFYDSMMTKHKNHPVVLSKSHDDLFCKIKDWLLAAYERTQQQMETKNDLANDDASSWEVSFEKDTIQQSNTFDCGIFAMINAYFAPDNIVVTKKSKIASCNALRFKFGMDFEVGYLKDPRILNIVDYFSLDKCHVFGKPKQLAELGKKRNPIVLNDEKEDNNYNKSKRRCASSGSNSGRRVIIIELLDDEEEEVKEKKKKVVGKEIHNMVGNDEDELTMLEATIDKQKIELQLNMAKLDNLRNNKI